MINFKKVVSVIVLFSFALSSCSNNSGADGKSLGSNTTRLNYPTTMNRCVDNRCNAIALEAEESSSSLSMIFQGMGDYKYNKESDTYNSA
ncbi:MAG: hypothetical protein LE168_04105, partial [Endomicrobium sp.]|nr:hypothetical protein [Endomicrobium sp.]